MSMDFDAPERESADFSATEAEAIARHLVERGATRCEAPDGLTPQEMERKRGVWRHENKWRRMSMRWQRRRREPG